MEQKRVFLAIVLSFLVLTVYQAYFMPAPPPPKPAAAAVPSDSASSAAMPTPVAPASPSASRPAPAQAPSAKPIVGDIIARDVTVETDTIRAVFCTEGATLKSWRLKRYLDAGQPLELVPSDMPAAFPRPFTLATDDPAMSATLKSALYQSSARDGLQLGSAAGTLAFDYQDESGLTVHKAFHFQPNGKPYVVVVDASVDLGGTPHPVSITWGPALGLGYSREGSRYAYPAAAVQFRNNAIERPSVKDLNAQGHYDGTWEFAGVGDQYFLSAVVPGSRQLQVDYQPIELPIPGDPAGKKRTFVAYTVRTPGAMSLPFFTGPKDVDVLRSVNVEMARAINFGMFAWLVVPLLQALKWLNRFIHNYGYSIIVLTALINLVIFPLRHRSMVSMRKMQALQPQIKAIQERYAKYKVTDPERQKMSQEQMALYKEKGVNPASGCVPMLLTMPVLFAFYSMLSGAIELRGAYFMGWIRDLSIHDPFYITPVLMGLTMFWQQRMMPSTADPVQQKIFLLMPLIFTFGFLWAPSGLVLYWLMSNLMAIGQQYATNRLIGAPVRPAPTPKR
jgi:YidC/Oxa1 family membrane protein insertase